VLRVVHIVVHFNVHAPHHVAPGALINIHHNLRTKSAPSISLATDQSDHGTDEAWLLHFLLSYHLHMQGALVSDRVRMAGKYVGVDDGARTTGRQLGSELREI
jgi:hypothetical protein